MFTPLKVKLFSTVLRLLTLLPVVDASGSPRQKILPLMRKVEWFAPHESFSMRLFLL
jgi:hypothetical protein